MVHANAEIEIGEARTGLAHRTRRLWNRAPGIDLLATSLRPGAALLSVLVVEGVCVVIPKRQVTLSHVSLKKIKRRTRKRIRTTTRRKDNKKSKTNKKEENAGRFVIIMGDLTFQCHS